MLITKWVFFQSMQVQFYWFGQTFSMSPISVFSGSSTPCSSRKKGASCFVRGQFLHGSQSKYRQDSTSRPLHSVKSKVREAESWAMNEYGLVNLFVKRFTGLNPQIYTTEPLLKIWQKAMESFLEMLWPNLIISLYILLRLLAKYRILGLQDSPKMCQNLNSELVHVPKIDTTCINVHLSASEPWI